MPTVPPAVPIDAECIAQARARLAPYLERTPLVCAESLSTPERLVCLKNETVLPTGSFKVRGAINALLARLQRGAITEVVAASTGNHGAAVAYAGRLLGVPARIFLPHHANPVKVGRIREQGATIVEAGSDLSAAIDAANDEVIRTGAYFLDDASDVNVPAGTATLGVEILEDVPAIDVAFVPMGDTALIRGVAAALRLSKRRIRVVGVVAERAPAYYLSWQSGEVIETPDARTIADGLAVRRPLAANVNAIRAVVDDVVTVSEDEMLDAIRRLRAATGIVAEPSGAAALAALVSGRWSMSHRAEPGDASEPGRTSGLTCVALVTGGNIGPELSYLVRPAG